MLKYSKKWNPYNKFIANVGCTFSFFIMKELIANYIGTLDKFLSRIIVGSLLSCNSSQTTLGKLCVTSST